MAKIIIPQKSQNGQIVMTIPKKVVDELKITETTPLNVDVNSNCDGFAVKKV